MHEGRIAPSNVIQVPPLRDRGSDIVTLADHFVTISSLQTGELTIYDAKSRTEKKRLKIGHGAAGILMDPDGSRAFVACSADNYIAVIDFKTLEVTSHLDVGGEKLHLQRQESCWEMCLCHVVMITSRNHGIDVRPYYSSRVLPCA